MSILGEPAPNHWAANGLVKWLNTYRYFLYIAKSYETFSKNSFYVFNRSNAITVCPDGWHLPSNDEWEVLVNYVGSTNAATKLKAKSGWTSIGRGWGLAIKHWLKANGKDNYGFSAMPGGYGIHDDCASHYVGFLGSWWSTSEESNEYSYSWSMSSFFKIVGNNGEPKESCSSVRCVKNNAIFID